MAFKEGRAFTDGKGSFCNEMARFASEEAAYFSGGENEAASANMDALAERAIRASANKNELRKNSLKAQLLDMKKEEKLWEKENEKSFSSRTDTDAVTQGNKKKELTKEQKKQSKMQAAKTALAKVFRKKGALSNELAGKQSSGDAFKDGKDGIVGTVLETMNPMHYLKLYMAKLAAILAPYIILFMTIAIIVVVIVALLFDVLQPVIEVRNAINSFVSFITGEDDDDDEEEDEYREPTFVTYEIYEEDIDYIIEEIDCSDEQEKAIRFALSKVGSPYSQAERTSGTSFDCSSLVYYAWQDAGVDISFGGSGPPTAAEEARLLSENGKQVDLSDPLSFRFEPGDLIFYGGSDNGRYKGIYHVAMYIGDLLCVEALNDTYGVVYRDLNTVDAIMICRPGQ